MRRLIVLSICLLLAACGSEDTQKNEPVVEEPQAPEYAADQQLYKDAAEDLIKRFSVGLKSRLMEAYNKKGAVRAIGICAEVAPEIAVAHTSGGWSVKRVSAKFRNPAKRPDTKQQTFLASFADTGDFTPTFLAEWHEEEIDSVETVVMRYYKPIRVGSFCLKCHGDLQTLAPGVYKKLKREYPSDHATGYKGGELRGMFVVEAVWPEGREMAEILASGAKIPLPVADTATAKTDSL